MAKDLPYFKFYVSEWSDGDITLEDFETQGFFINVCAFYWSRKGDVSFSKLSKRFANANADAFQTLITEGFVKVDKMNDRVYISFLDEQIKEFLKRSEQNRINGQKGGRTKKASQSSETKVVNEKKANALQTLDKGSDVAKQKLCNKEEKRGEEKREEKKREEITLGQSPRQSLTVEERKINFKNEIKEHSHKYPNLDQEDLSKFFNHWTQMNPNGRKMTFEKIRDKSAFDVSLRLSTWSKNKIKFDKSGQGSGGQSMTALDFIQNFD
jgi:hypothetical protein